MFAKKGSFSIDDGTATTTSQINNLIGRVRKISVLHVWHALMNKSVPSSAKQQREITKLRFGDNLRPG